MDINGSPSFSTRAGTVGGTLLTLLLQINAPELFKTVLLAATDVLSASSFRLLCSVC